jgi:hypothetical protein
VYNVYGQLIKQQRLERPNGNIKLDVEDMASGVYFYKIEVSDKASAPLRMVITR